MNSFLLRIGGREDAIYSDTQIAQMFADRRVNRYTPCKLAAGGDWKTIDDFLPMLKYGTQLPPPTRMPSIPVAMPVGIEQRVAFADIDIPFLSIVKILFKWIGAVFLVTLCFAPVIVVAWLVFMAVFASVINAALHHQ